MNTLVAIGRMAVVIAIFLAELCCGAGCTLRAERVNCSAADPPGAPLSWKEALVAAGMPEKGNFRRISDHCPYSVDFSSVTKEGRFLCGCGSVLVRYHPLQYEEDGCDCMARVRAPRLLPVNIPVMFGRGVFSAWRDDRFVVASTSDDEWMLVDVGKPGKLLAIVWKDYYDVGGPLALFFHTASPDGRWIEDTLAGETYLDTGARGALFKLSVVPGSTREYPDLQCDQIDDGVITGSRDFVFDERGREYRELAHAGAGG